MINPLLRIFHFSLFFPSERVAEREEESLRAVIVPLGREMKTLEEPPLSFSLLSLSQRIEKEDAWIGASKKRKRDTYSRWEEANTEKTRFSICLSEIISLYFSCSEYVSN